VLSFLKTAKTTSRMPPTPSMPSKRDRARELRRNATNAERKLWTLLRGKRFGGWRFRRQHPVGPYFADFFCAAAKLIIELDGGQHGEADKIEHDDARTLWLQSRGYKVRRFWNSDVMTEQEAVLDAIWNALREARPPHLPAP
jgi:very-short-patch-repair endonuclease